MGIDYKSLLEKHGVEYSTRQASEGNISVACPFCNRGGDPDPSQHLGINLKTGAYNCWRNASHKGRKPHRLLKALVGMSYAEVDKLLGVRASAPTNEFDKFFSGDPFAVTDTPSNDGLSDDAVLALSLFVDIKSKMAEPHRLYLQRRGITTDTAAEFGLLACSVGRFAGRVVFPVFAPDGVSVATWTARSIGAASPKYLALGSKNGANIKHLLYRADRVQKGGDMLVVTEGPLDAIVLQQLAPATTVTCTFGLSVSDEQIALIKSANFPRVAFLFDSTAYGSAIACAARAGGFAIDYESTFYRAGDPGDLTENDVSNLRAVGIR